MELQRALDLYVTQLAANGRSQHTLDQARRHVLLLDTWLGAEGRSRDLDELDHEDVALFLASETVRKRADGAPRKATSANALRSSLRAFFRYSFEAGIAPRNAARLVRRARVGPRPPRALSEAGEARLRAALQQAKSPIELRDRAMFELMLDTGLRVGSVVALRVEDLDQESGELRVTTMKGAREMVVRLGAVPLANLAPLIGERRKGWIFEGRKGEPITTRHVQRRLQVWLTVAGLRRSATPHAIRHTYATRIYRADRDLVRLQVRLGHTSILSTARYASSNGSSCASAKVPE